MKKLFFVMLMAMVSDGISQETYRFVKVPEKFDSFKEENQYQLNALTAFLFEKAGYEAIYKEPLPAGIDVCDILSADVLDESGFLKSKVVLVLEDCQGNVVFRSEKGKSNRKDYKGSFQEALRDAFASLDQPLKRSRKQQVDIDPNRAAEGTAEKAEKKGAPILENPVVNENSDRATKFVNANVTYSLRPSTLGYELYREDEPERVATLVQSEGGKNFIYTSKNLNGNAFFDSEGNLIIEYVDEQTGLLAIVRYKLKE